MAPPPVDHDVPQLARIGIRGHPSLVVYAYYGCQLFQRLKITVLKTLPVGQHGPDLALLRCAVVGLEIEIHQKFFGVFHELSHNGWFELDRLVSTEIIAQGEQIPPEILCLQLLRGQLSGSIQNILYRQITVRVQVMVAYAEIRIVVIGGLHIARDHRIIPIEIALVYPVLQEHKGQSQGKLFEGIVPAKIEMVGIAANDPPLRIIPVAVIEQNGSDCCPVRKAVVKAQGLQRRTVLHFKPLLSIGESQFSAIAYSRCRRVHQVDIVRQIIEIDGEGLLGLKATEQK